MAQSQTTVEIKDTTAPNNTIRVAEFNNINDTINTNSTDAESRLTTTSSDNSSLDSRLDTIEATTTTIASYTEANLPVSATNGTVALNTTKQTLVVHRDGEWYYVSDISKVIDGFEFKVKTDNTGTSLSTEFQLPLVSGNTYNFTAYWGDGTSDVITTDTPFTHDYGVAGEYTIKLVGTIGGFKFDNGGDRFKMIDISGGLNFLQFDADGTDAFYGCENMTISDTSGFDTSLTTDFQWFFYRCYALNRIPPMDLSSGNKYFAMFRFCSNITELPDLDFSNGTNGTKYREMFRQCGLLTSLDNCTFGDARTDAQLMFRECTSLTSIPTTIDWSNVTNLSNTFYSCPALTEFPVIPTGNVTNFNSCWFGCTGLTSFPVLDTSSGSDFLNAWRGCTNLATFPSLNLNSGSDFTDAWLDCALDSASVDNILAALVANGSSGLTTSLAGGTTLAESSWSAQAQTDVATLRSNGWTVLTN